MNSATSTTFHILTWVEESYEEITGGAKLTLAKVTQSYDGQIRGVGIVQYLMAYSTLGTASFVGVERINGEVDGKSGSFVIRHLGEFAEGIARSSWTVVAGAGTDELSQLAGTGSYVAGHSGVAELTLNLHFSS